LKNLDILWLISSFSDRKPPGVGRGRGRGREEGAGGRQPKGIGRGFDDGSTKGAGGGRGKAGPSGKPGGNRGKSQSSLHVSPFLQSFVDFVLYFTMPGFKEFHTIFSSFSPKLDEAWKFWSVKVLLLG